MGSKFHANITLRGGRVIGIERFTSSTDYYLDSDWVIVKKIELTYKDPNQSQEFCPIWFYLKTGITRFLFITTLDFGPISIMANVTTEEGEGAFFC